MPKKYWNNSNKKWSEDLNTCFSKEDRWSRWPKSTWKSIDAQHHLLLEKCKSKLQWGITSEWSEWPSSKSLQTRNAEEGVEKKEASYTVDGNVNCCSHYGEHYGGFLITKNRVIIWSRNPMSIPSEKMKTDLKRYMHPNVHSSTIHNNQNMEAT